MTFNDWLLFKFYDMQLKNSPQLFSILKISTFSFLLFCSFSVFAQQPNSIIQGKIIDKDNEEAIPFANVVLIHNDNVIKGTSTDFDGNYQLDSINAGNYDLQVSYVGYQTQRIKKVKIASKEIILYDIAIEPVVHISGCGGYFDWRDPLIEIDNTSTGEKFLSYEINRLASF